MDTFFTNLNQHLNFVDWVYVAALIISALAGFVRKLSAELAGLIISAAVFLGGWKLYGPVSEQITQFAPNIDNPVAAQVVSLLLICTGIFVIMFLLFRLLRSMLEMALPNGIDRLGGLIAGFLKAAFIICTIIVTISICGHTYLQKHFIEESWFGAIGNRHLPGLYETYLKQHLNRPQPAKENNTDVDV